MQEDFLHYLWEFQKWGIGGLKTTDDNALAVIAVGQHNFLSGPDFFNSRIVIEGQEWAGNVEIHLNSSDWYGHGHEADPNYDNVILHVVWNHDTEVFRKNNSVIPVLELKSIVPEHILVNYRQLLKNPSGSWINCEKDFPLFDGFQLDNWLDRLFFERLEEKSNQVFMMLEESSDSWEEVLFKMLAKNFGLNINAEAFLDMANSVPFGVVQKTRHDRNKLEALFLGQAGLLEKEIEDGYYQKLQEDHRFLAHKFNLSHKSVVPVKYFRLRPDNFPNLRLAQLASLYHQHNGLFSKIINAGTKKELQHIFELQMPEFWEGHFTFTKTHPRRKKTLSPNFIDLLIINTIVPIKFCHARKQGKEVNEEITALMASMKQEENNIVKKFNGLRPKTAKNAMRSQALLQLKKQYCDRNRCLKCNLGLKLLQRNAAI